MTPQEMLAKLRALDAEGASLRQKLRISAPNQVLFLAPWYELNNELAVVEADGFGGAKTSIVEGNYPIDFVVEYEKDFPTEGEAVQAAEYLMQRPVNAEAILS